MKQLLQLVIAWIRKFVREKLHSGNEELPYYIVIFIALILFVIALTGFVELTDELAENELGGFDSSVSEFVVAFRNDSLTSFFTFITHMGDRVGYAVISICIGAYFFIKHRSWRYIIQILIVLTLSTLSNILIKRIINRERPSLEHLVTVNTLSYPSGHSMAAMAFYGFLVYLCLQLKMNHVIRLVLIGILIFTILSIGISRIYLGVHYPSDVAAGFAGGFIWVTLCVTVFNVFELSRKRKN